jgi:hypothetical protein
LPALNTATNCDDHQQEFFFFFFGKTGRSEKRDSQKKKKKNCTCDIRHLEAPYPSIVGIQEQARRKDYAWLRFCFKYDGISSSSISFYYISRGSCLM